MCGIAGLWDRPAQRSDGALHCLVGAMADTLSHRGPDDRGTWADQAAGVAMGHRRLSVLDPSPAGHQPMASPSGRWTVSYNGEVYNFGELRGRLAASGARWRGGSDTEVLVAGLDAWGVRQTLERMDGQFALACWDGVDRSLWLARDRLGEKPLYYGWSGHSFAFASEIRALRRLPAFPAQVDRSAIEGLLSRGCISAPRTIFRDVLALPPGTLLRLDEADRPGTLPAPVAYWSAYDVARAGLQDPLRVDPAEAVDRLESALLAAVRSRLVADVPVGAFLSGGADSTTVVAVMQRLSGRPVRTFTVGFADRSYDESGEARSVARHLGTEHTDMVLGEAEALAHVGGLAEAWDEPFADSSQLPMLLVSGLARASVTVCLSGDGGDELFAGYNRHRWMAPIWRWVSLLPTGARAHAGRVIGSAPPETVERAFDLLRPALPRAMRLRNPSLKLAKLARMLGAPSLPEAYGVVASHWLRPEDLVVGSQAGPGAVPPLASLPGASETEAMLLADLVGYLPNDILTKLDRATMAHGLEARVPLLDPALVALAWRLPLELKVRAGEGKWLLRQVLRRYVPDSLVRRPKMGFGIPIGRWLRGPLRPWAEDLLSGCSLRTEGYLDPAAVRAAWQRHLAGRQDLGQELWDVCMLQAWSRRWAAGS